MSLRTSGASFFSQLIILGVIGATATPAISTRAAPEITWHSGGDSYSAGEGVSGNQGACAQSPDAFGPSASELVSRTGVEIVASAFTACTGHLVEDFLNPRPGSEKSSLLEWAISQGLEEGRSDIITMSFGGNDIGFADTVADCLPHSDWKIGGIIGGCDDAEDDLQARIDYLVSPTKSCTGGRWSGRQDSSFDWSCDLLLDDRRTASTDDDLRGSIADFYRLVADRYLTERGRLYIVGYPGLFAPVQEWPAWNAFGCQGVRWGDAEKLDRLSDHLDRTLERAVAEADAGTGRVEYISRRKIFRAGSHELCGSGEDWINGVSKNRGPGIQWARYQTSFHPNRAGHRAIAEVLAERVIDLIAVMESPSHPSGTDRSADEAKALAQELVGLWVGDYSDGGGYWQVELSLDEDAMLTGIVGLGPGSVPTSYYVVSGSAGPNRSGQLSVQIQGIEFTTTDNDGFCLAAIDLVLLHDAEPQQLRGTWGELPEVKDGCIGGFGNIQTTKTVLTENGDASGPADGVKGSSCEEAARYFLEAANNGTSLETVRSDSGSSLQDLVEVYGPFELERLACRTGSAFDPPTPSDSTALTNANGWNVALHLRETSTGGWTLVGLVEAGGGL